MSRHTMKRLKVWLSPLALLGVWACYNAPVETPAPRVIQETDVRVEQNVKNKVDIVFLIDNSPSMSPKQAELKARFPELIKILDNFGKMNPAWYHIGVITSDLGAGQFTLGGGQCHPGGDGGKLQLLGAAADTTCKPVTGGVNFIDYNQLNGTNNLPAGQDLPTTFGCMSSVGDKGCGFEHQLEATYRALKNPPAENHDFLRPDALLVVVFVTDEDDCSADPNTDLFDPSKTTQYGALLSYRCTNYSIACNGMLMPYGDSGGNLAASMPCTDADPTVNKLVPVSKYINFFSKPAAGGGVKVDPHDVIMVDITAPTNDVESILANPSPMPPGPYVTCPGPVDGMKCAVVLQHSCIAPTNTQFFGDPAVRIRQVVNTALNKQETSICDTSYQAALQSLGNLIVSQIGAGCITSPFSDPNNPDCIVEDVTSNNDGSTSISELPRCDQDGGKTPCWRLESKDVTKCAVVCANNGDPGQHFGVTIDRGPGGTPPPNTTARVACSTIAVSKDPQTGELPMCGAPL
jgi:hypothetical protein